ncbi:MAG: hypothetical protein ACYTGP_10310 [Planctomycetota bacterium]
MNAQETWHGFPERCGPYARVGGCFALSGDVPRALAGTVLFAVDGAGLTVCDGEPPGSMPAVIAVYARDPGGAPSVPTGKVHVRFVEGVRAEDRADDLVRAGYEIDAIPPPAPHTAWLRPADGEIATALAGLERLGSVPDVEHVEPEMLRPTRRR